MLFEQLFSAEKNGELILVEGGILDYHLRKDGQATIHIIISQKKGAGKKMLNMLIEKANPIMVVAKCPDDLDSNGWYAKMGFKKIEVSKAKTGREINTWMLPVRKTGFEI